MGKLLDSIVIGIAEKITKKTISTAAGIAVPDNVREYLDLPYKNRRGETLLMDVFEPIGEGAREVPMIIYIHGGGLVLGDKSISKAFCLEFAKRGFLVFSLNYTLVPIGSVYDQFDDISCGMDYVGEKIIDFDINPFRIYLVSESAGAYLSIYTAAISKSLKMQQAMNRIPTRMNFKAMALIGGMFYTNRDDIVGKYLMKFVYRDTSDNKEMEQYLNPENPEVAGNLPPCLLVTSEHDFLRSYSERLTGILWKQNIPYHFVYMGDDKKLTHAFPVFHPEDPESQKVIDIIKEWFDAH